MLQFFINTFHSFILTVSQHNFLEREYSSSSSSSSTHCRNILLGLRILIGEIEISNVLVIRRVITIKKMTTNQDSFSLGFLGSSAGSVMESMSSCTESLGFESSDQLEEDVIDQERLLSSLCSSSSNNSSTTAGLARSRFRRRIMIENERRMIDKRSEQVKNKIFPPPLSSLNRNGHRKFYLKSERDNGRLEITVKKINRPEILRASRQDGRLTLHLMKPQVSVSESESKEEAELKESKEQLNELDESEEELNELDESEEELNELEESVVKEDKERAVSVNGRGGANDANWKFLLPSGGGGESFRRCYDLTHHHHGVSLWSNHYVMTG
ncbi:hypothetical protein AQUCO_01700361v1 [Aquilegia coerulea]|uniref:FAF domain-containing protein n=1 Tax=Aquilegia coerulea TaxID=218851 RepID=A0A2G5DMH7_AQUCA|nr:hypothetical protein AQUCO_01700361v1 [Aquilegia coerulea]